MTDVSISTRAATDVCTLLEVADPNGTNPSFNEVRSALGQIVQYPSRGIGGQDGPKLAVRMLVNCSVIVYLDVPTDGSLTTGGAGNVATRNAVLAAIKENENALQVNKAELLTVVVGDEPVVTAL